MYDGRWTNIFLLGGIRLRDATDLRGKKSSSIFRKELRSWNFISCHSVAGRCYFGGGLGAWYPLPRLCLCRLKSNNWPYYDHWNFFFFLTCSNKVRVAVKITYTSKMYDGRWTNIFLLGGIRLRDATDLRVKKSSSIFRKELRSWNFISCNSVAGRCYFLGARGMISFTSLVFMPLKE